LSKGTPAQAIAARPGAAVTLSYLIVTLPLALRVLAYSGAVASAGATGARAWLVVATHVLAIAVFALVTWDTRLRAAMVGVFGPFADFAGVAADWLPLLIVSFLYAELPWLMAAYRGTAPVVYHDAWVQHAELAVFGTQPSHRLAGALPWNWISEPLHLGYISYYLIIYLPPLLLFARRRREAFSWCVCALMLAFTSCFLFFALFPVEGPRYAWPPPPGIPDGPIRRATLWVLREGSSRGAAFPSSHAAVSVSQTVALWLFGARRMALVAGVFTALLVVGAVYGGFHYAIDMVVGALVGTACAMTASAFAARRR
jgi:membrane-associated phospholipid phosphatase